MKRLTVLLALLGAIPLNACASFPLNREPEMLELPQIPPPPPPLFPVVCLRTPEEPGPFQLRSQYPANEPDRSDAVIDDLQERVAALEGVIGRENTLTRACASHGSGQAATPVS